MNTAFSFDKSNLREVILSYANQLEEGRNFAEHIELPQKEYSNLIISGMGGSALPADLLINYLRHQETSSSSLPVYISRSYALPKVANENSLVFISSYSGNTEETVSCFDQALKTRVTIVAFSANGKVEKMAKKNDAQYVKYAIEHPNFQPRYATTYAFAAMHHVLTKTKLCDRIDQFPEISPQDFEERGEKLAQKIKGKTPIIYASDQFRALAKTLKVKFNENAKAPAFWNYFPELNHNEMVGFTLPQADFFALMLKDNTDHPQVQRRVDITAELYNDKGIETEIVELEGETYLEKVLNGMILGDWISYYLAKEYNQDPTPVDMVENLKKRLI